GLMKFMRRMAFQQLWHQKVLSATNTGRTIHLLLESKFSSSLDEAFKDKFGLSRVELVELSIMAWAQFIDSKVFYLKNDYFSSIYSVIGEKKAKAFFEVLGLPFSQLEEFGRQLPSPKNYLLDVFTKSPFS